ncbi:MAG TPA: MASE1 domain-containing protein, partial [Terriglobales bacterium]|nr:MASE1 domain-containing protein [Terriglobales bacterium]
MSGPAETFFSLERALSHERDEVRQPAAVLIPPQLRVTLVMLAAALAYYFGTEIGYLFTPSDRPIGTLWPPNAILLAMLLLTPTRTWPFLFFGVLPAHLFAQLSKGVPISAAIGWFLGNTSEALVGAACIRFFISKRNPFDRLRGIVAFLTFGVFLAPFVTSFLDAAVVVLTGQANGYWMPWTTRLSSNMLSDLIFVPIIVAVGGRGISWVRNVSLGRWTEVILLISGTAAASFISFGTPTLIGRIPPLICVPLAFLLWAALRFDLSILSTSLLVIAFVSIWNAMAGRGPLPHASMIENVLFLHFFLLGLTVPLVLLIGYSLEQRRTSSSLVAARNGLIGWEDQECERVGRRLHNDIVQQLALIAVEVDRMRYIGHLPGGTDLDTLYRQVTQVSDATRDLSHEVHPFVLEYAGLAPALTNLCRRAAEQNGIDIRFVDHGVTGLEKDASVCFYRVTQEALQNVVQHSGARSATVELAVSKGKAVLRIADDGIGMG